MRFAWESCCGPKMRMSLLGFSQPRRIGEMDAALYFSIVMLAVECAPSNDSLGVLLPG